MIQEVRSTLTQYLEGAIDRLALQEWLVSNVQAIIDSDDLAAIAIVDGLEALFARLSEGLVSEEDFFERVAALIFGPQEIAPAQPSVVIVTYFAGSATLRSDNSTPGVRPVVPA